MSPMLLTCRRIWTDAPSPTATRDLGHLAEELLVPTYEIKNGKIRVMSKDTMRELLRRSPDRADALCLTFLAGGFFAECDLR